MSKSGGYAGAVISAEAYERILHDICGVVIAWRADVESHSAERMKDIYEKLAFEGILDAWCMDCGEEVDDCECGGSDDEITDADGRTTHRP